MAKGQYRVVIVGPGDEVLDEINLDGVQLMHASERQYLGAQIASGMGTKHLDAAMSLPPVDDDD